MKIEMKNHLKPCAAISVAIMVVALVLTLTGHGMNLGIDFTGGTLMTYDPRPDTSRPSGACARMRSPSIARATASALFTPPSGMPRNQPYPASRMGISFIVGLL